MVWAFAKVGHKATPLFNAVAKIAVPKLANFKPQELTNTVYAFAIAEHDAPALFDKAALEAPSRIEEFRSSNLSNLAWSFARKLHGAPKLFDAIANEVIVKLELFQPQEVANTVYAFALMGHSAPLLFEAVAQVVPGRLPEFKAQEFSNTMWAFAVADARHPTFLSACMEQVLKSIDTFIPENLVQLHQVQLWIEHELLVPELLLPEDVRRKCTETMKKHLATVSGLQAQVAAVLSGLVGSERLEEELVLECGYSVDLALLQRQVVIEVDGPSHFRQAGNGGGRIPTGKTYLKCRQLKSMGWHVLSVPHFDWYDAGDAVGQRAYLERRLEDVAEPLQTL